MSHYRLIVRCTEHPGIHAKVFRFKEHFGREYVETLAKLLDGTSPHYIYDPGPDATVGKCATCGASITTEIEERDYDAPERGQAGKGDRE